MKQLVSSGTSWETIVGYSRAIRVNNIIELAGTTAMDGDEIIGKGDLYLQTKFIFSKIQKALVQLGASLNNVVRTRMFVTNIADWQQAGKAHGEFFSNSKPMATLLQVAKLIDNDLLIEIEVTAILEDVSTK